MADRFWVGGTGNWSDTARWSATDGGAGGATVPTSTDNARFTALSNTTAYTVTVDATANCADLLFSAAPSVSGTITLAGSAALNVYGSLLLLAGMTRTYTGAITFSATATGKTITTNGVSLGQRLLLFSGVGGGWTLQDAIVGTADNAPIISLVSGSLDTNGKGVNLIYLQSLGTSTRSLTLGTSTITIDYSSGGVPHWRLDATGLTFSGASSSIEFKQNSATFYGGGQSYGAVQWSPPAYPQSFSIRDVNTFVTLSVGASADKVGVCTLYANQTVTGTLTITGNSATNRLLIQSNTLGTPRTITAAAVSLTNCDFMDITGAGAASPFTGTSLGNALGNSGITFTPAADQYWYTTTSGTKTWSTAANWFLGSGGTGGAGRVPLPQDNVIFNASSIGAASTTVSADMPRLGKDITWTGVTNSPAFSPSVTHSIYGSLTLVSGMTIPSAYITEFCARSSVTLTSAGKSFANSFNLKMPGGTLTLADALTLSGSMIPYAGTFTDAGYAVTIGYTQSAGTHTFNKSGNWTLTWGSGSTWVMSAGTTLNDTAGFLKIIGAAGSAQLFTGAGKTYNNLWLSGAGSGAYNFTGANTFADIKVDNLPKDIRFTAGTNTTLASFTNADAGSASKFVRLPGVSGAYCSTPDSAANSITGDIDLRWYGALADWTPAAQTALITKDGGSTTRSYGLTVTNTGVLSVHGSTDGTTGGLFQVGSSVGTGVVDGAAKWIRATIDVDDGAGNWVAKFYTSDDGAAWTQLGTTQTNVGTKSIFDSTAAIEVGGVWAGAVWMATGCTYRAQIYNGINGTLVADFNPNDWTSGNTWTSSTTGEIWTRNGSALIYPEIKISSITAATHTLTKTGGGSVTLMKGNITNSTAAPASTFSAFDGVNGGGNTNWSFTTATGVGAASGSATVTGVLINVIPAVGSAVGSSTADGTLLLFLPAVGLIAGGSTVDGQSQTLRTAVATAAGTGTPVAIGQLIMQATGASVGSVTVSATGLVQTATLAYLSEAQMNQIINGVVAALIAAGQDGVRYDLSSGKLVISV